MKDELRRTSEHYNKVSEMQSIGQREAEMQYKERLFALQDGYQERKVNIEEQYKHLVRGKEGDLKKFVEDGQKYVNAKK